MLEVSDAVPGRNARIEAEIAWPTASPTPTPTPPPSIPWKANKWHYVAAVVAGSEPGEMALLFPDSIGTVPLVSYGTYAMYNGNSPSASPGYSYVITDMAEYVPGSTSGDEMTFHGFFRSQPPQVYVGALTYTVEDISPTPSANPDVTDWVLDVTPTPPPVPIITPKAPIGIRVLDPDPGLGKFQRRPRGGPSGDDVLLLFHQLVSGDPSRDLNFSWQAERTVSDTVSATIVEPATPSPKMWLKLASGRGWPAPPAPWWDKMPKLLLDDALSGDLPAGTSTRFYVGRYATPTPTPTAKPAAAVIDDVKISRLNPLYDQGGGEWAPAAVPARAAAPTPVPTPDMLVDKADGWPERGWLLVCRPTPTPIPNGSSVIFFQRSGANLTVTGGTRGRVGESIVPLSFLDVALAAAAPGAAVDGYQPLSLDDCAGLPRQGYLLRQTSGLSTYGVFGYVRQSEATNSILLWQPQPAEGAYGTKTDPIEASDILTEVPIRYWDRFTGITTDIGPYQWVKEEAPALMFRARKRLPGSYLEAFSWRYPGNATSLPGEFRNPSGEPYAGVYVELILDGQRVLRPEFGNQVGYFDAPVDGFGNAWRIRRSFDEIEVRVYFDYTGPNTGDNAYISGACNIAPKIDRFLLYLRQPVSTAGSVAGSP